MLKTRVVTRYGLVGTPVQHILVLFGERGICEVEHSYRCDIDYEMPGHSSDDPIVGFGYMFVKLDFSHDLIFGLGGCTGCVLIRSDFSVTL